MAGMCFGVNMVETETTSAVVPRPKSTRRRRMGVHQFNFVPTDSTVAPPVEGGGKRKRQKIYPVPPLREFQSDAVEIQLDSGEEDPDSKSLDLSSDSRSPPALRAELGLFPECPKYGMTSICGRRRDMEDAVAIHPSFCAQSHSTSTGMHFFGVYDGHGCSHVATRCGDRMHEIVKQEFENEGADFSWERTMLQSFLKMDKETRDSSIAGEGLSASACRCELQTPQCDAVGSTAVVAVVTSDKIVVANCGDSRAVLCRNGVAVPLSVDHKPDRPDEMNRIQEAGGRVIFWDGPRVLGVLAMSRAIGDNYLKPYVIPEPEVTVTERTSEDECLILASDGLWDVVSNETAATVARTCLRYRESPSRPRYSGAGISATEAGENSDKACSDASILLTELALARHSTDNVSVVVVDLRRKQ